MLFKIDSFPYWMERLIKILSGWKIVEEYEKVRNTKSLPILSLKLLRKGWGCTERKIKKKKKSELCNRPSGGFWNRTMDGFLWLPKLRILEGSKEIDWEIQILKDKFWSNIMIFFFLEWNIRNDIRVNEVLPNMNCILQRRMCLCCRKVEMFWVFLFQWVKWANAG